VHHRQLRLRRDPKIRCSALLLGNASPFFFFRKTVVRLSTLWQNPRKKGSKKLESLNSDSNKSLVECVSPINVRDKDVSEIAGMFGTHDWAVESGQPIGESGVLIRYSCKRCKAEGYSVVTTKGSSTSKILENRILSFA
jgi:hypothetical protein